MNSLFDLIVQAIFWYLVAICIYVGIPAVLFFPIDALVGGIDQSVLMYLYGGYCIFATIAVIWAWIHNMQINSKAYKDKKLKEMQEKLSAQSVRNFEEFQRIRQLNHQSKS